MKTPAWAQGEGWKYTSYDGVAWSQYVANDNYLIDVYHDGLLSINEDLDGAFQFATPEDARKVADMLITGKVQA